jgi:glycosyltransferase involved in cell wall biosynthesis
MHTPFISICVPVYKNYEYLKRLLDSLCIQEYTSFEVLITDDGSDINIKNLCLSYTHCISIFYFKNYNSLGTPENWNQAIRKARGKWIKLMHDDDWFANRESLGVFAEAAQNNPHGLIVSYYYNVYFRQNKEMIVHPEKWRILQVNRQPFVLIAKNCIGPPSVMMHRNDGLCFYDNKTKWVVDIDFYMRRLMTDKLIFIKAPLIKVGISDEQVTMDCFSNPEVELPENFYLLNKFGKRKLFNVLVYDFFWRLLRNYSIKSISQIRAVGFHGDIPFIIESMVRFQKLLPRFLLTIGIFSKIFMVIHYCTHYYLIKR